MQSELPWIEKYRPTEFAGVAGQEDVIRILSSFVAQKRMSHVIFAGPAGVGKTTCALILAKKILGESWRSNFLELNASDDRKLEGLWKRHVRGYPCADRHMPGVLPSHSRRGVGGKPHCQWTAKASIPGEGRIHPRGGYVVLVSKEQGNGWQVVVNACLERNHCFRTCERKYDVDNQIPERRREGWRPNRYYAYRPLRLLRA